VKPGIAGWAQVNQGAPWLDVLTLFLTIMTMLTGWGAR